MKFTKKAAFILAAAVLASGVTVTSVITATEYSAEDPLISKSWIDNIFYPQIVQYVDTKIEEVKALLSTPEAPEVSDPAENTEQAPEASVSYEVITMTRGQTLRSAEGSLEIILRPGGTATVYSEIDGNGIADLTNGTELVGGTDIPINAYCLIPRADSRGIVCTSDTAYVMVRGKYVIA